MDKEVIVGEEMQLDAETTKVPPMQGPCIPQIDGIFRMLANTKMEKESPES